MTEYFFIPFEGQSFKEEGELLSAMITIALYGDHDEIEVFIHELLDMKQLDDVQFEKEISRLYNLIFPAFDHLSVLIETYVKPVLRDKPDLVYIDDVDIIPGSILVGFERNSEVT